MNHLHTEHHDHDHHRLNNVLLFGGLSAGLAWTLFIVWYLLTDLAKGLRVF